MSEKTQNIANATCPVEDSERVHQNIDLHDFTHLFDILKGDLKSMQIEVGQRFIHATANFFFLHNLLKTIYINKIRIKFNNIDIVVNPGFLIASI